VALDGMLVQPDDLCSDSSSIKGQSEPGLFGVKAWARTLLADPTLSIKESAPARTIAARARGV